MLGRTYVAYRPLHKRAAEGETTVLLIVLSAIDLFVRYRSFIIFPPFGNFVSRYSSEREPLLSQEKNRSYVRQEVAEGNERERNWFPKVN